MTYRESVNQAFTELGVDCKADDLLAKMFQEAAMDIDDPIPVGREREKTEMYKSLISQHELGKLN